MREPKKFVYKGNKYEKKSFIQTICYKVTTVNEITEIANIIYFST